MDCACVRVSVCVCARVCVRTCMRVYVHAYVQNGESRDVCWVVCCRSLTLWCLSSDPGEIHAGKKSLSRLRHVGAVRTRLRKHARTHARTHLGCHLSPCVCVHVMPVHRVLQWPFVECLGRARGGQQGDVSMVQHVYVHSCVILFYGCLLLSEFEIADC